MSALIKMHNKARLFESATHNSGKQSQLLVLCTYIIYVLYSANIFLLICEIYNVNDHTYLCLTALL